MGLTGGIASGKSTLSRMLARMGCVTVDADAIVARLYLPGQPGHIAVVGRYGPSILRPDQTIDRNRLADLAFSTEASARELNGLIHPLVRLEQDRLSAAVSADTPDLDRVLVVEASLLVEAGNLSRYDRIVVVDLAPELQLDRAESRGMARSEAQRRMSHQLTRQQRLQHADYIVVNDGGLASLEAEAGQLNDLLRGDLEEKKQGRLKKKTPRRIGGA